jgi:hypothetical protein
VRDQVLNRYKTTDRIIVVYFLVFIILDSKLKDKIFWTRW